MESKIIPKTIIGLLLIGFVAFVSATPAELSPIEPAIISDKKEDSNFLQQDIEKRLYALSQKIAGLEHILFTDDKVRARALRDILLRKGVTDKKSLEEFIKFNKIDEKAFNIKVQEAVDFLKLAQWHGAKAYDFFLQKDFSNARNHIDLAEKNLEKYLKLEKELTILINSWKNPRESDLASRIYALSQKVATLEARLFTDDGVRAKALRKILEDLGVGKETTLEEFIKFNKIDEKAFNQKVQNAVTAMKTAQALGFKAYNFFLQKDFQNAENYLTLAEAQVKIFEYLRDELSNQINSWKNPTNKKNSKEDSARESSLISGKVIYDNKREKNFNLENKEFKTTKNEEPQKKIFLKEKSPEKSPVSKKSTIEKIINWILDFFS